MCCRYYFDEETLERIHRIATIRKEKASPQLFMKFGDIHPQDFGVILRVQRAGEGFSNSSGKGSQLIADVIRWGFPMYVRAIGTVAEIGNRSRPMLPSGLHINVRAESALEKPSFRGSVKHRRCVIPASHFYEWNREKEKVTFSCEELPVLYLAGFYDIFQGEDRFVVLTTEANSSMRPVHDRMPLILTEEEAVDWVCNEDQMTHYLEKIPPMLRREQDYEQQTLFL